MGFFLPLFPLLLISLSIGAPCTDAWGKEGHFMICKIAGNYLTENATRTVKELLPPWAGGELAEVCSWADEEEVRRRYSRSPPLHYANTPGVCNFDYCRDCHDDRGRNNRCVVGAINEYTRQLQNYGDHSNTCYLTESLMFLAHFMGDVHQPLHVGFASDRGGTRIRVRWLSPRNRTNLHKVWDTQMIRTALWDFYNDDLNRMIEYIEDNYIADEDFAIHAPDDYASESVNLACAYAYKDTTGGTVQRGSTLTERYFHSRIRVVERRIAQAGARLAALLNNIFCSDQIDKTWQRE